MITWRLITDDDLTGRVTLPRPGWQPFDPGEDLVGAWRPEPGRAFPRRAVAGNERDLEAIIARIEQEQPQG